MLTLNSLTFVAVFRYILFHKPYRVLSQFSPEGDKVTLANYFPGLQKDIYPVGRLDYDSEGLLLLTNDKQLTHALLEPSFAHPRTYWVQVEGSITNDALYKLQQGLIINIDGKQYKTKIANAAVLLPVIANAIPARLPPIRFRKEIPDTWVQLTLTEGKNRQVRRMTAAVGFPTLRLIRAAIGGLSINGLIPGEAKEFGPEVKQLLLSATQKSGAN